METNNKSVLAAQIMARYRQTAQKFGPFFGQQLFTVVAQNPDLKFKEDQLNGRNGLRQEIKAYIIKAIDVVSVSLMEKDVDGQPKIVLNEASNDPSLVFPLAAPDFSKATRANVSECIDRLSKPGSKPMFFAAEDLPTLNELVRVANQGALNAYEEFARKFVQLSETVRGYMEANDRIQSDYLRQCGVNPSETTVNVKVEVNE